MPVADHSHRSLRDLIRLDARRAAITGGAQGIGLAMARRFAEAGAAIALGDLNEALAAQSASDIERDFGVKAIGVPLDVRNAASVTRFGQVVETTLGGIDIWINNAAIYPVRLLVDMSEDEWDLVSDINLRGCFLGAREAARRMVGAAAQTTAVILNVSSVSGFRGRKGSTHYTATKHAVIGLTRSMALELAPHNIRVLAIAPTLVSTPGIIERRATLSPEVAALEESVGTNLPLGRIAVPDDVARAALFCASDMAALMTGSTIFVDSGATAS